MTLLDKEMLPNLAYLYLNYLNAIADNFPEDCSFTPLVNNIFNKAQKIKIDVNPNNNNLLLTSTFNLTMESIQKLSRWDFPMFIKNYINFIKMMEKVFFFNNDASNYIFAEVDELNSKYKLVIDKDDYVITYELQDTAINLPNTMNDSFLDFLDDNPVKENKVIFIDISIKRNFGEEMQNSFKFVQDSPIPFTDKSDDILYTNIIDISKRVVFDSIFDILNNVVLKMSNMKYQLRIEELLGNETINVWRRTSKSK